MGKKIMVILFGIIAIAAGIYLLISGNNMAKRCTTEATGTVVEIIEEREENTDAESYGDTYTYYPVIEFNAGDKVVRQKSTTGYGNKDKYKVGDNIDILYDANKPEDYLIKGDKTSSIIGIIFIVAGVIILIAGFFKRF